MHFSDLNLSAPLLKALNDCGFLEPTQVQAKTIPTILSGRDLIGSSATGTGKTAAFLLPALMRLENPGRGSKGAPRVLVLTPTRELAAQIMDDAKSLGRNIRFHGSLLVGGVSYHRQLMELKGALDLVVATPGRLIDHLDRGKIDLGRVEILVLDEADRMLDMGFIQDVERIAAATPDKRQTLMFTATLNRAMTGLAGRLLDDPVTLDLKLEKETSSQIEQRVLYTDGLTHKHRLLEHLIADQAMTRAIIFSATKRACDGLARTLASQGHRTAALHGDMSQRDRDRTVRDLRQGRVRLLVATDVAARGLDVTGITHVINFDLPKDAEGYVHRIGRTGRAGATGKAISFASPADLDSLHKIQRYLGRDLPREVIPGLEPSLSINAGRRGPSGRPGNNRGGVRRSVVSTTWKDARRQRQTS